MTQNRRIVLNIVATYGRSLYALLIGLFCGRWVLMSLGEVDYGLMGVVGGMTAFVSFINGIMASGVGRFYAVSIGEARRDPEMGLERCRQWFTTSVVIHTVLPIVLIIIGYPIGDWAVRNFLVIPPERISACVWVWRFSCISCFIGMSSVPYYAMYGAKQEIAELSIYSFVTVSLNVVVLYHMVNHPADWLARYSLWGCCLSVVPPLIITARSFLKYKECRFRVAYMFDWGRIRRMFSYSGWFFIGNTACLLRGQGINLLVNKYFGPSVNAAQSIGHTMSAHCLTLSGSLIGAFSPVIQTAYGAGDLDKMRTYVYRVCRIATIVILIFALPLALEADSIVVLWLKNPPKYVVGLCILTLVGAVVDKTSFGYAIAAHACEKISLYQIVVGGVNLFALPIALLVASRGAGIYWIASVVLLMECCVASARVVMARRMLPLSIRYWMRSVVFPIAILILISGGVGFLITHVFAATFWRICLTTFVVESVFISLAWLFVLNSEEKGFLKDRIGKVFAKGIKHG